MARDMQTRRSACWSRFTLGDGVETLLLQWFREQALPLGESLATPQASHPCQSPNWERGTPVHCVPPPLPPLSAQQS